MAGDKPDERFLIGEVAERTGLTERTLRYYEEQGLLSPTDVSPGGFRLYSSSDLHRLEVIQVFKDLGFSLSEIRATFERYGAPVGEDRHNRLAFSMEVLKKQLNSLDEHLSRLHEQRDQVRRALQMLAQCRECKRESCPATCPNLEAFL